MQRQREARQPGDRAVAPGRLALVQSFVNSVNVEFGPDEFGTVDGLAGWLTRNGLGGTGAVPDELDLRDAVTLREALRALLREHNGEPPDEAARRTVEHIARDCPLVVTFGTGDAIPHDTRAGTPGGTPGGGPPDGNTPSRGVPGAGPALRPALPGMRGVFGTILAICVEAGADGSWQRLKACREHRCEWAFYDRSRNRGSRWCSMAVCGTRAKMATYRQAKRTTPPHLAPPPP